MGFLVVTHIFSLSLINDSSLHRNFPGDILCFSSFSHLNLIVFFIIASLLYLYLPNSCPPFVPMPSFQSSAMTWLHSQPLAVILSDRLHIVVRLPYNRTRLMFSLLPDKPSFVYLPYIECKRACVCVCVLCFLFRTFCIFERNRSPYSLFWYLYQHVCM